MRSFGFVTTLLLLFQIFATAGNGAASEMPFSPGERLTFKVRWTVIPAGDVTLEVFPDKRIKGKPCHHFIMKAKTTRFADYFYKVRDRIDSYAEKEMKRAVLYRKRKEGKSKRDVTVDFDWQRQQVVYSNFGRKGSPVDIRPGTFDPLSVFYAFRNMKLSPGKVLTLYVSDGKKIVLGTAKVLTREKIDACGKVYDSFLVEPALEHLGGVFEKSRDAKLRIWVTADEKKIPVRIESEVMVGSFVAELIRHEQVKIK